MKKIFLFALLVLLVSVSFAKKKKNKFVIVSTTMGTFKLEIFSDVPLHSVNFLKLVKDGFYDSILFHRVIPDFMVQGGDPDSKTAVTGQFLGDGDKPYTVPAEFQFPKYFHKKGALCAARDNKPDKSSSACQFYVVVGKIFNDIDLDKMEIKSGVKYNEAVRKVYRSVGGTPHLDGSYTVYGQCVKGQEVIDAISNVERDGKDRPNMDIRILKMKIKRK